MARAQRRLKKAPAKAAPAAARLGELIALKPEILHLLDEYGITFCAGCYLTLMSSPERAAVYHAVPNPKKFLKDLEKTLKA